MTETTAQPAEVCCVCGSPKVGYRNYLDQPFCWPCADGPQPPGVRIYIEPRDAWVGVYVAKDAVYVCPLPFLVIRWRRVPGRRFRARELREAISRALLGGEPGA